MSQGPGRPGPYPRCDGHPTTRSGKVGPPAHPLRSAGLRRGTGPSLRVWLGAALLGSLVPATGSAQGAEEPRCTYTSRSVCTTEGCTPTSFEHAYLVIPPLEALRTAIADSTPIRIRRCDDRGCVPIPIEQATSEGFLTLSARTGAFLLKIFAQPDTREIGLRTGDFTEVVTSMMLTYVGYGRCVPRPPPP